MREHTQLAQCSPPLTFRQLAPPRTWNIMKIKSDITIRENTETSCYFSPIFLNQQESRPNSTKYKYLTQEDGWVSGWWVVNDADHDHRDR